MTAKAVTPSQEQRDILGSKGNTIVISNPGTGKTTTLSLKVIQLLREGADPDGILCITFTKKARREMYDAIYAQGKDEFPEQVKRVHIHTFHSYAYGYLADAGLVPAEIVDDNHLRFAIFNSLTKNNALHYGKDYIISDIVPGAANSIKYIKSFGILPGHIDVGEVSRILEQSHNKKSTYTLDEVKAFLGYFVEAYDAYEKSKTGTAADYTDVLLRFLERFEGPVFEHVLIDEMQDMNEMQAEIARRVARDIFLVGDAKQAIFGFQGGSTKHLGTFQNECTKMLLSENRRSTNQILDYAKRYYLDGTAAGYDAAADLEEFRSEYSGESPVVISTEAPLSNVLRLIRENPGKDVGIIARTNAQVVKISEFLYDNNVQHATTTSQSTTYRAKSHITDFLAGLLYDDAGRRIRAALTVFSPYTLREGLGLAGALELEKDTAGLGRLESWGRSLTAKDLDDLFDRVILPICVSRGPEWFFTARSVKQDIDRYLEMGSPTLDGLFDYLAICEEPLTEQRQRRQEEEEDGEEEQGTGSVGRPSITVSTIHKAKGREFDVVAYLPKDATRTSFLDSIKAAIMQSRGIDVEEELGGEQMRLHFVAFTRARERLAVISDTKSAAGFHVEGLSEFVEDGTGEEDEATGTADAAAAMAAGPSKRLQEAYALFVSGREEDAQRLLKRGEDDGWLEDMVADYFENMVRLSYSKINTKPSEFLEKNIINVPRTSASAEFGRMFHEEMRRILGAGDREDLVETADGGGDASYEDEDPDAKLKRAVRNGLDVIDQLKSQYPGWSVHALEKRIEVPISDMTAYDGQDDVTFSGKLDAVFRHDAGYLIIDYKTSKRATRASDNHRQLAAYRRILSRAEGIPEDSIDTCVVFVALTGAVNTGRFDYEVSRAKRDHYPKFEEGLQKILEWKQDSSKFIDELLEEGKGGAWGGADQLHAAIRERLEQARR